MAHLRAYAMGFSIIVSAEAELDENGAKKRLAWNILSCQVIPGLYHVHRFYSKLSGSTFMETEGGKRRSLSANSVSGQ
jgi:hypothetical protein